MISRVENKTIVKIKGRCYIDSWWKSMGATVANLGWRQLNKPPLLMPTDCIATATWTT